MRKIKILTALFIPRMLVFENGIKLAVAFVTFGGNDSLLNSRDYGAAVLFYMRAFRIFTFAVIRLEFTERERQSLARKEIESFKIEKAETGSIRYVSSARVEKLNVSCRLLTALDLMRKLARFERKIRIKLI